MNGDHSNAPAPPSTEQNYGFREFQKIPRLNREVIITEKIDGTNGCVVVTEDGCVSAQSRSQIITPENDNFGFARWVLEHEAELVTLGPGYHYGEWWGMGIQRKYGLTEKRFSLFNVHRWGETRPACCHVVPVIMRGTASQGFSVAYPALELLRAGGSLAQSNLLFKATLEKDEEWKGKSK